MEEIWKDISGFEGYYQVSNLGRVKSCPRQTLVNMNSIHVFKPNRSGYEIWNRLGKILQPIYHGDNTPYVRLYKEGAPRKTFSIKTLVYNTFNHTDVRARDIRCKDGDDRNVALSNLYYGTHEYPTPRRGRSIRCIETGQTYLSIIEASRKIEAGTSTIRRHVISGKPLKGYTYEFVKEEDI